MQKIPVQEAVGHVLCHDMTRIVKDEYKDAQFRKGHVVREEDIPLLLSMGKEHIYAWEKEPGTLHENEAAERLAKLCKNANMERSAVKEGKIDFTAACEGLFLVDVDRLNAVNGVGELMIATRHGGTVVKKGDKLAGTRVIPLIIDEKTVERAEALAGDTPLLRLLPFQQFNAAVITTGSEVKRGLIQDTFTPVVEQKLKAYGIRVTCKAMSGDDMEELKDTIARMREEDVDLILCTGGMSVDPDDNTPGAIKRSGADIVTYGAPVLPGAMFLLGYFENGMPIMGLPGCVMYAKATVFDLALPRIAAGIRMTREDFVRMGNGGLCLGCEECHYPVCPFGKCTSI